jgi:tRNA (mo5U34)-methyltransferase
MDATVDERSLRERVAAMGWYQTIRLPGGLVTPGSFDTLDELSRLPFPASLKGRRCLDVGTAEGFWAFEMERRGASDVLAVDVSNAAHWDWPGNTAHARREQYDSERPELDGFQIAHEALRSNVARRDMTIYSLTKEELGEFDYVFVGSLLLHLRDPVRALAAAGAMLAPGGELLSVDAISPPLTAVHPRQPVARLEAHGYPMWWAMNLQAYRRLFAAAGLEILASGAPFMVKQGPNHVVAPNNRGTPYRRVRQAVVARLGTLHSWVRAQPAS